MDDSVGVFEAKKHLSKLITQVRQGGTITITHRGKPVAQLIPYREGRRTEIEDIVRKFREIRKTATSSDNVKGYIRKGRDF